MQNLILENKLYMDILLNSSEGTIGRKYLKFRNISKKTAIQWGIGYCPIGYVPPIYKNESYPFWEKLWGRITFGIYDQNGVLVSISGRKVLDVPKREKNPKYDHYPFNAKKVLFGLWQNKENIFKENKGIITEGQLDVITSWQKGLNTVTSSFGAHAGENHIILLSRYTNNIFIVYDADDAGQKGIQYAKRFLRKTDLSIKYKCPFPNGLDLDTWMQTHTKEEFYNLIDKNKVDYLKYKLDQIYKK